MATDFQALLDQYSSLAGTSLENYATPYVAQPLPVDPGTLTEAERALMEAAQGKSGPSGADGYRAVVAERRGVSTTAPFWERDLATMTPMELYAKYGDAASSMIASQASGSREYFQRSTLERSGAQATGDTVIDIGRALSNLTGGIATLGTAGFDYVAGTSAAPSVARFTEAANDWLESRQSDTINTRRGYTDTYAQLGREEDRRSKEKDKSDGYSPFVAGLRDIGRGVLNGLDSSVQDPSVMASEAVNAGASLIAVGPLSRGISYAVSAPVNAVSRIAPKAFDLTTRAIAGKGGAPSVMAAIGLMEGGGAAVEVSNRVSEIIETTSHEELLEQSPLYRQLMAEKVDREEAKRRIVNQAILEAGGQQFAVGAVTGRLVSRIEGNVFRAGDRKLASSILRETVEESIQGATAALASNSAVQRLADESQELSEGVGESLGKGALYGGMSAGAIQAPISIAKGSVGAAKATGRVTVAGARKIIEPIMARGDRILTEMTDRNPLSVKSMLAGAEIVATKVPVLIQSVRDSISQTPDEQVAPEAKARLTEYVGRLFGRAQVEPTEVESMPMSDTIKAELAGARTRFELINILANFVESKTASPEERAEAAIEMHNQLRQNEDMLGAGAELYDVLENTQTSGFVPSELSRFNEVLSRIKDTPIIRSALEKIGSILSQVKLTDEATPDNINKAVAVAEIVPESMDPDVADKILLHEEQGQIQLTDYQRQALKSARALARAQVEYQAAQAASLKPSPSVITDQIRTETTGKGEKQPSALGHMKIITEAMRRGDTDLGKAQLTKLVNFGQTLQNKVAAINRHLVEGDGTQATGITYQNWTSQGIWRESQSRMSVNPTKEATIDFAQRVQNDARAVAQIANGLIEAYPELGLTPVEMIPLAPELLGNPREVARRNIDVASQQAAEKTEVTNPVTPSEAKAEPEQTVKEPIRMTVSDMEEASRIEAELIEQDRQPELALPEPEAKPEREQPPAASTVEETKPNNLRFFHGSPNSDLSHDSIQIIREAGTSKQSRNGRTYGGFYVTEKLEEARGYSKMGEGKPTVYEIDLISNTKIQDIEEDVTRLSPKVIEELRTAGVDVVRGKDIRGRVEYAIINEKAIERFEAEKTEVVADNDSVEKAVDKADPFVRIAGLKGHFGRAFKVPADIKSRLMNLERPVSSIMEVLTTAEKFEQFLGVKPRGNLSPEIAGQYASIIGQSRVMAKALIDQMNTQLDKVVDGKSIAQHVLDGTQPKRVKGKNAGKPYDLLIQPNNKVMNLLQEEDGRLVYNPNLMGSAILAGIQWTLIAGRYWSKVDSRKASNILGIPEAQVEKFLPDLRMGLGLVEAKQSLAAMIQRFWGVTADRETDEALSKGIAESMAGEVLRALQEANLVGVHKFKVGREDGLVGSKDVKDFERFMPYPLTEADPIQAYTSAIEEAVLIDAEPEYHIGTPPKNVARTQMNNPRVENTEQAKAAIQHENSTPYLPNVPLITLWEIMGEENIVRLFGHPNLDKRKLNQEHAKTLAGQNLTLTSAYATMIRLRNQMANWAGANGVSLEEAKVYFDHNMSKVGRMQQLGQNSPQASKLVREVYLPMQSTLDLSSRTNDDFSLYGLALAQALGIKVHAFSRYDAITKVLERLEGAYAPAVEILTEYHKKPGEITGEQIDTIREALGGEVEPMAFHALFDYARLQASEDKSSFKTQLYVEADGVANGISNAIMMTTHGFFEIEQLQTMAKAGVFVTDPSRTMNDHRAVDNVDLYGVSARHMGPALNETLENTSNSVTDRQVSNILRLLDMMGAGVTTSINQETGKAEVEYDRGLIKNPATITVYGSGERGIAGNIVGGLLIEVYKRMSVAAERLTKNPELSPAAAMFMDQASTNQTSEQLYAEFLQNLAELGSPLQMITNGVKTPTKVNFETFKIEQSQFEVMVDNVHQLFVKPLRVAITKTVGEPVMESMDNIRKATQVQGIFLKYAFQAAFNAKLEGKSEGEFLSPKEQDEIFESLKDLVPVIETDAQKFYPAGSEKSEFGQAEFGRALNDQYRTAAYTNTPENPGVRGMPMMIIGNGDAYAMQTMATMANPVEQTIKIFDGVNMALHLMEEGSRQANEAAFAAMMQNPVANVLQAYNTFMQNVVVKDLSNEQRTELVQALFGFGVKADTTSDEQILEAMRELAGEMQQMSRSIEARHNVLKRVRLSVDQMAAVGASFQQKGDLDLSGMSNEQATQLLNKEYVAEYARLAGEVAEDRTTSSGLEGNIAEEIQRVSSDGGNGVRTVSPNQLKRLLVNLKIPAAQKSMLSEIVKSMSTKDYRVVVGSLESIRQWANETGRKGPPVRKGTIKGFISFEDKVLYMTEASSETLVHELIHGSTFEKVVAYYKEAQLGENAAEQRAAIKRIEALANQFVALGKTEGAIPDGVRVPYDNARAAMQEHLRKGGPLGKAAALNEFMAWSLTNEKLSSTLSKIEASPLARLAKAAMLVIKKLIWGKRAGVKVADDMLSNLQFNTAILMNSNPTIRELVGDTILFQSEEFGNNERLIRMSEAFERKIVDYLDVDLDQMQDRNRRYDDAMMMAYEVGEEAALHFPMNMQESGLFKMVVAALATQAQLDPNSLNEVGKLYSHVAKNIAPASFMPANSTDEDADRHYAQLKYDFIVGRIGGQKDTYGRSTLLPSFLALSMVSEEFRRVLREISIPKAEINNWSSVDNVLENTGTYLMDQMSALASGADRSAPNVEQALQTLTDRIVEVAQDRELWIDQVVTRGHGVIDRMNSFVTDKADKLSAATIDKADQLKEKTDNKLARGGLEVAKFAAAIISEKSAGFVVEGFMSQLNKSKITTWMHELANEVVGRTSENANVYDLIKLVRARVQQVRQQFREDLPEILKRRFNRELKKEEWTHLFKAARTDLGALQGMTEADIVELLRDGSLIAAHISEAEEKAASLAGSNWNLMQQKAKDLAEFMNTRKVAWKLLRNAKAIASLHGEGIQSLGVSRPSQALVEAIDHLVSLYALDGLSQETKVNLHEIATSNAEGLSFTISYLIGQRKDELAKVIPGSLAEANHFKGYLPSEGALGAALVVAEVATEQELLARGYRRLAEYKGSSVETGAPRRAYYFSPVSGRGMFNQGILQNVKATASGVDPVTGFSIALTTGGQITDPQVVSQIKARLARNDNTLETLMPVYNASGETIAYERAIDPIHDVKLDRNTNLAEMIGAWHGRQVEEEQSRIFNHVLAQRVKSMWVRDKTLRADEYVNVFGKGITDPVIKDAVSLISQDTRDYIETLFGKNQFWVRKDMINDVLGYRNASLGDSWSGISRWPKETQEAFKKLVTGIFGGNAYRYLMIAERTWQNLVQDAKVLIVIKSVIVPIANFAANFIQLLSRGVPINDIVRSMPKKVAEIQNYVESRERLLEAEAELRAAGTDTDKRNRLKAEMQEINDRHRRLSIWPLINAGEFSAISDVGVTREQLTLSEGRLTEFVEQLTSRLPSGVRTLGRYAIISRDTALFKGLQRAIEYGDFLGKTVLYDHLTKKKGLSHQEAMGRITEEFVNYDRLAGRARGALENNGFMWFWNFKLRSMKVGLSIIRNNPVHAFLAMNIPGLFGTELPGSPVTDNAGAIFMDDQRAAYSLGFDQLWKAHFLNPWMNLIH